MRRVAVGLLALILLGIAAYGFWRDGLSGGDSAFFWSVCLRLGLVLGAIWLALPRLLEPNNGFSPTVMSLIGLTGLILVVRPRALFFLWPLLLIAGILHFFRWLVQPPAAAKRSKKS